MQIVPQYIDVEDRIAGPLTWKHLGWMFGGGGVLLIAYALLDRATFFIVAIPIGLFTAALAFYKPNGIPFVEFLGYGFTYLFRPKRYVWKREIEKKRVRRNTQKKRTVVKQKKTSIDEVVEIAHVLDSRGKERNERIQQLIRQANKK